MAKQQRSGGGARRGRRRRAEANGPAPVVGLGASAGGIRAFRTFVKHVPSDAGIAWVLIQHMSPDRESRLSQILARNTKLPVMEVLEATPIEPDRIYVNAPRRVMSISDGMLRHGRLS